MISKTMEERIKNLNQDITLFTYENIIYIFILSTIYILFRRYLYIYLQKIFINELANGNTILRRVDPRIFSLKVLPCVRRTISGIFLTLFAASYLYKENWIFSPSEYSVAYKEIPLRIKLQYYFEFTHYLVSVYFLIADPRSKDFIQMMFHHFLSLFLIILSYKKNFLRYGVIVMFLHEICDPLLELGKISSYFNYYHPKIFFLVSFSFVFAFFRFIFYPCFVVVPVFFYFYTFYFSGIILCFGMLLFVLYLLNFIWMMYIGKMWVFFIKNGYVGEDSRSIIESE
ncbi:hypothetical protein H311_00105 [Anncaliia algerae PRA109]|nr:hypothetical protein H311_00105 [Anncaliia algerae PRA109]